MQRNGDGVEGKRNDGSQRDMGEQDDHRVDSRERRMYIRDSHLAGVKVLTPIPRQS